jgi:hypothetical protein
MERAISNPLDVARYVRVDSQNRNTQKGGAAIISRKLVRQRSATASKATPAPPNGFTPPNPDDVLDQVNLGSNGEGCL